MLRKVAIALGGAVGLYSVILGALLTPNIQRFALYANKINTLFWDDLSDATHFGFAKNQVTPFNLSTPDDETLFAWHILPLDVYARHEKELREEKRPHGPVADFTQTTGFRLLTSKTGTEPARVVVNFHGNAGHVAQGWRPDTYRALTALPNTHVLTIDYRGFGHSTGSPTEAGLITDGTALVDYVLSKLNIPPERIVILGQSLGTAVSSAVALNFASRDHSLIPAETRALQDSKAKTTTFAGVILVAPFSSIPSLMLTYRIGGIFPILLPFRVVPSVARSLTSLMVDHWPSAERLAAYTQVLAGSEKLTGAGGRSMGALQLIHAVNDMDISYHQTELICHAMLDGLSRGGEKRQCIDGSQGAALLDVAEKNLPRVRFEIVEHGGHNRIVTYSPVQLAVSRAFADSL